VAGSTEGLVPSRAEIRAELILEKLSKVLTSSTFAHTPTLCRLLRYLVEQTLAANKSKLKEYSVGIEVFDRGPGFDPSADTIVRVEARRLRSRLEDYYAGPGRADPIRITLPKGHYAILCLDHREDSHRLRRVPPNGEGVNGQPLDGIARGTVVPRWVSPPRTPLIGRELDTAEVTRLLLSNSGRLVTLTGACGTGKTRLALHVISQVATRFPAGVQLADFAAVTSSDAAALRLAHMVGLRRTGGKTLLEALCGHLHSALRAPSLLFIDNFDHIHAAGPLVVRLLEATAFLTVVIACRSALDVYGEHEYLVPPLPTPDLSNLSHVDDLSLCPAVRLFVERATSIQPVFALNEEHAPSVAEICWRLNGLPLAIELAAARVKTMTPLAMREHFAHPLAGLPEIHNASPALHQAARGTIVWSYGLLSAAEQKLLRRLAVFAGGCTLEGAEAVCNTRADLGVPVREGVSSLARQGLLQCLMKRIRALRCMRRCANTLGSNWLRAGRKPRRGTPMQPTV
jgi:predicted ATPase